MISKVSELLELFIQEETKKLGTVSMPHMPTLGSAHEEITKQGIDKNFAIPKALNILTRFCLAHIEFQLPLFPSSRSKALKRHQTAEKPIGELYGV